MRTLKANSRVLGLYPGDTFQSDDPFYNPLIEKQHLSVVEDSAPTAPAPGPAEGSTDVQEPVEGAETSKRGKRGGTPDGSNG